jgi:hypothetical protein
VEPDALGGGAVGEGGHWIDRRPGSRLAGRHDRDRTVAGRPIPADRSSNRSFVGILTSASRPNPTSCRTSRSTNGPPPMHTCASGRHPGGHRCRVPLRRHRRLYGPPPGRSANDVEAVSVMRPSKASGRPSAWRSHPDDDALELRRDRRRPPQHRELAKRRGQHLADDSGPRGRRPEIGEETRMLPMGRIRLDEPPVVGQDRLDQTAPARVRRPSRSSSLLSTKVPLLLARKYLTLAPGRDIFAPGFVRSAGASLPRRVSGWGF